MIVCGGPDQWGIGGVSSPKVALSILWMRTRRRAAVSAFGSGWSWEPTSTMKAEVTAENRPAYDPSQSVCIRATRKTHEYQCCVQIFTVSLAELLIILIGHLAVISVEPRTKILWGWVHILPLTVREVSATFMEVRSETLPVSQFPVFCRYSPILRHFFRILAAVRC